MIILQVLDLYLTVFPHDTFVLAQNATAAHPNRPVLNLTRAGLCDDDLMR